MMEGLFTILPIMMVAGLLGAAASTALNKDERSWETFKWNFIIGVSASFLIPVLLTTVSSDVLQKLTVTAPPAPTLDKYLVFGGYCLLGAISAQRLITTLSEKVLQIARDAKTAAQEAKVEATETRASMEQTKKVALAAKDAIQYGITENPMEVPAQSIAPPLDPALIEEALTSDDPWKGKFGGKTEVNDRKLQAELVRLADRPSWAVVSLKVNSTSAQRPLTGTVTFFLHPTFKNYNPVVPVSQGEAVLNLTTWGAFTVGAVCDDGRTKLELDLSQHPDAWEPWKSR